MERPGISRPLLYRTIEIYSAETAWFITWKM